MINAEHELHIFFKKKRKKLLFSFNLIKKRVQPVMGTKMGSIIMVFTILVWKKEESRFWQVDRYGSV